MDDEELAKDDASKKKDGLASILAKHVTKDQKDGSNLASILTKHGQDEEKEECLTSIVANMADEEKGPTLASILAKHMDEEKKATILAKHGIIDLGDSLASLPIEADDDEENVVPVVVVEKKEPLEKEPNLGMLLKRQRSSRSPVDMRESIATFQRSRSSLRSSYRSQDSSEESSSRRTSLIAALADRYDDAPKKSEENQLAVIFSVKIMFKFRSFVGLHFVLRIVSVVRSKLIIPRRDKIFLDFFFDFLTFYFYYFLVFGFFVFHEISIQNN